MTQHIPKGFHAVTPYLIVPEAEAFTAFLVEAFGATILMAHHDAEGRLQHSEVKLEGSILELAEAREDCPATRTALHLFVPDVDEVYQRALKAGASPSSPPQDQPYGERSGGVKDRWGNTWYLATVIDAEARSR